MNGIGTRDQRRARLLRRPHRIELRFRIRTRRMQRRVAVAGDTLHKRDEAQIAVRLGHRPGISVRNEQMIAAGARDVRGSGKLHVGESIGLRRDAVRGAGGLDRVDAEPHGGIADRVQMNRKAFPVHPPDVFHDRRRRILKNTRPDATLARQISMGAPERPPAAGRLITLRRRPDRTAIGRVRVDVAGDGQRAGRIEAEDRLQVRPQPGGFRQGRRLRHRIAFDRAIDEIL